jgi:hypothetical protein
LVCAPMIQGLEGGNPIERLSLDEMALHEGTCVCARVDARDARAWGRMYGGRVWLRGQHPYHYRAVAVVVMSGIDTSTCVGQRRTMRRKARYRNTRKCCV